MRVLKWLVVLAMMFASSSLVFADKVDDFREAVKAARNDEGCKSIPYSDLQSNCVDQGRPMHDYCDGKKGSVTCDREGITRGLKNNLEREERNLDELKRKRAELDNKKSRAADDNEKNKVQTEIDQVDNEIKTADRAIEAAKNELEKRKTLVNDAIYNLERCIDHRQSVANTFVAAAGRVRGEDDTATLALYARELKEYYDKTKPGHDLAITYKKNALSTCRSEMP